MAHLRLPLDSQMPAELWPAGRHSLSHIHGRTNAPHDRWRSRLGRPRQNFFHRALATFRSLFYTTKRGRATRHAPESAAGEPRKGLLRLGRKEENPLGWAYCFPLAWDISRTTGQGPFSCLCPSSFRSRGSFHVTPAARGVLPMDSPFRPNPLSFMGQHSLLMVFCDATGRGKRFGRHGWSWDYWFPKACEKGGHLDEPRRLRRDEGGEGARVGAALMDRASRRLYKVDLSPACLPGTERGHGKPCLAARNFGVQTRGWSPFPGRGTGWKRSIYLRD